MSEPRKRDFAVTEHVLQEVEKLAGFGLTSEKIGFFYGLTDVYWAKLCRKNKELKDAMERGRAKAETIVSQTAFQMATSGKHPTMTMFWLRTRAGWKVADQLPIQISDESSYPAVVISHETQT